MSEGETTLRRVRFYGAYDLAIGRHVPRVAEIAERFDPEKPPTSTEDALELHNVQQYLEHGFLPNTYNEEQKKQTKAKIPQIQSAVARFFSAIDNTNFAAVVAGVDHEYHGDLLDLLGRNNIFNRCDSATVLPALTATGVHLGDFLANKNIVQSYDTEIRDKLRASPRGAEYLVQKYLQDDTQGDIHIPQSFTSADARELLKSYIDSNDANLNYVRLIATAKKNPQAGIDAKLKLHAKRREDELTTNFFAANKGLNFGCEVSISDTQNELVVLDIDTSEGWASRYTYSNRWLEETCDNPSILNNFIYLFDFIDFQALLVLPSYPAQLSVMERIVGATGKNEYKIGAEFQVTDMRTFLQTHLYHHFLKSKDIDLEQVISWFFEEYLSKEFRAFNFSFTPSSKGSPYLQRVRHLFVEMESAANQFTLFAENGELDRDLLTMDSAQVRYKKIPSLLKGKYVYPSENQVIANILYLLFSDQSDLKYINESLKADNASKLILENRVKYDDFEDYQKPKVDYLIEQGVLEHTGTRVQFASTEQLLILSAFFTTRAVSYYHLSDTERAEADTLVANGWATRDSSLLTKDEGDYFNYFLNGVDFSNGPQLRNKYLHGSQAKVDDENTHFNTYIIALRLIVALVIKINEDFCLEGHESLKKLQQ